MYSDTVTHASPIVFLCLSQVSAMHMLPAREFCVSLMYFIKQNITTQVEVKTPKCPSCCFMWKISKEQEASSVQKKNLNGYDFFEKKH